MISPHLIRLITTRAFHLSSLGVGTLEGFFDVHLRPAFEQQAAALGPQ